ncbi:MAG: beta-lactamase family protein [Candidatus Tectomicrobia bacterium]|nr:beta-lactamase family protein [Candidatus Tectomicrobia bacterium]
MKKQLLIGLVCFVGLSFFTACSGGDDNSMTPPTFDRSLSIEENVDQFFAQTISPSEPGAAVLIVKDGVSVHQKGYGLADIDTGVPIETDSQFELASVSKQFTALGVLLLFERGLLKLDDPIRTYLPELSPSWDTMTIRHLVAHQAGIPDHLNEIFTTDAVLSMTNSDIFAYFVDQPQLDFEPGSAFKYTNGGYLMLAELITRVTHSSFREFMQANVFAPFGMTLSTVDDESRPDLPTLVTSYRNGAVSNFDPLLVGEAGIVSTIDDLFRYQEALLSGQIVSPASLDIAFTDQTNNGSGYSFGWYISEDRGHTINLHGGTLSGFSTQFVIVHDLNVTLIMLSNSRSYGRLFNALRNQVIRFYEN